MVWYNIIITLDSFVYTFVNWTYQIFILLAKINVFEDVDKTNITTRMYMIMSVVMLFVIAYSLLKTIVDPDKNEIADKGKKIVVNTCISIILVIVFPYIFDYMAKVQSVVIDHNILGNLILGTSTTTDETSLYIEESNSVKAGGKLFATEMFDAFMYPDLDWCDSQSDLDYNGTDVDEYVNKCALLIIPSKNKVKSNFEKSIQKVNDDYSGDDLPYNFYGAKKAMELTGDFKYAKFFAQNMADGEIEFNALFSLIGGIALVYVIVSFCFDLGIRAVKLLVLQIFAPVPILFMVLPGKGEDIFKNWLKKTIATYLEVFIRLGSMFVAVYIAMLFSQNDVISKLFKDAFNSGSLITSVSAASVSSISKGNWVILGIAKAFVYMGIIAFAKQAPGLIKDITGLDAGGIKLGIKQKFAEGGGMTTASLAAGVSTLAKRTVGNISNNWKQTNGAKAKAGLIAKSVLSGVGGGIGAGARAAYAGINKKDFNYKDIRDTRMRGESQASAAKDSRDKYRAYHSGKFGVIKGKVSDAALGVKRSFGIGNKAGLEYQISTIANLTGKISATKNAVDAVVDKEIDKGSSSKFVERRLTYDYINDRGKKGKYITDISMEVLKKHKNQIDVLKAQGASAEQISRAQQNFEAMKKAYATSLRNDVYNESNWNVLTNDQKIQLGDARIAAQDTLAELKNNLNQDYVYGHGINSSNIDNLTNPADVIGKVKDDMDLRNVELKGELAKLNREEEKAKDPGKGGK